MKTSKPMALLTLVLTVCMSIAAQSPVTFGVSQKRVSPTEVDVIFTGKIQPGWHVYSTGLPADGPISATITTEKSTGAKPMGALQARGKEISEFDDIFGMKLRYFENNVTFVQRYEITGDKYDIQGFLEFGACNDQTCMPPTSVEFSYSGEGVKDDAGEKNDEKPEQEVKADTVAADSVPALAAPLAGNDSILWQPVVKELGALNGEQAMHNRSLWYIFLMGLLGGLVALFTPCVWPIIPMTVSFFLKRAKNDKKKGVKDALTYGASIVVIYLTLGLAITGIFGPSALNAMSTNAVFNLFFCALLVVFALSFFGWFELTLPSKWSNKVDSKAGSTSGMISIFLMAFTLALVSFSCTGPIIGFLLVDFATSGSFWGPAVGMLGFAIALALPFTLFAIFPTWLKSAPKSGGWMNIIKVTLGFIELAFALKFFSVADLAYGWRLLDREVFLCLWIVIFGALGLYLIGKLKFQSDWEGGDINKPMPVICIMGGLASIAFAIYMLPGLWGAPCKAVSAFAPPMWTQDFNLNTQEVRAAYTDYEEGMAAARAQGKPVIVDFTGFGCVNCRKMEAAVWTDPSVARKLNDEFVLISLFVDDKTRLPEHIQVTEADGTQRTLRTVGDKWSYLQRHKFGFNAQPFYVTLDHEGRPLSRSFVYKEDVADYMDFLNTALDTFRK